jgi:hypothetical protein
VAVKLAARTEETFDAVYAAHYVPLVRLARSISRLSDGFLRLLAVRDAQFATGLVADAVVRDPGSPRRGPWPWWWRLTLGSVIVFAGWLVWRAMRRRGVGLADVVGLVDLRVRPRRPRGDGGAGGPSG